jgi:hypothetical protein
MDARRVARRMVVPFGVLLAKADAALRPNPEGKTDCGRMASLPLRLLVCTNGAHGA